MRQNGTPVVFAAALLAPGRKVRAAVGSGFELTNTDSSQHSNLLTRLLLGAFAACMLLVFALLVARLTIFAYNSRHWCVVMDGAIMQYIAWRIDSGAIPYADVADMNQPGTYLINIAILHVFGAGDVGWRNFDYAVLALTLPAIFMLGSAFRSSYGIVGCILYSAYHFSLGTLEAGQRDFYFTTLLLWAAYCCSRMLEAKRGLVAPAMAGLLIGMATTIKPTAVLTLLIILFFVMRLDYSGMGRRNAIVLLVGSFLVSIVAIYGWVAYRGGLGALFALSDFIFRVFPHIERRSILQYMNDWGVNPMILFSGTALAILILVGYVPSTVPLRAKVVASFTIFSFLHIIIQGKGWAYHLYPLIAFSSILAAPYAIVSMPFLPSRLASSLLCACLILGIISVTPLDPVEYLQPAAELTGDLKPILGPQTTLQTFDMGDSALALLRLRQPLATRNLYDAMVLSAPDSSQARKIRAQFLDDFRRNEPDVLVIFYRTWPKNMALRRFDKYPQLRDELAADYCIWKARKRYEVCVSKGWLKSSGNNERNLILRKIDFAYAPPIHVKSK